MVQVVFIIAAAIAAYRLGIAATTNRYFISRQTDWRHLFFLSIPREHPGVDDIIECVEYTNLKEVSAWEYGIWMMLSWLLPDIFRSVSGRY